MHATLIVNPCAHRVTEKRLRAVERELARVAELTTVLTERRGHGAELAREAAGDAIFAYGGDGLCNEVLNGADGSIPVGLIPGGHTNVLPRALGLPGDPAAAAAAIAAGQTRRISLGRVNGRRFAFAAGIGAGAEAVRRVDALGRTPAWRFNPVGLLTAPFGTSAGSGGRRSSSSSRTDRCSARRTGEEPTTYPRL